jgi:hypothetical protein
VGYKLWVIHDTMTTNNFGKAYLGDASHYAYKIYCIGAFPSSGYSAAGAGRRHYRLPSRGFTSYLMPAGLTCVFVHGFCSRPCVSRGYANHHIFIRLIQSLFRPGRPARSRPVPVPGPPGLESSNCAIKIYAFKFSASNPARPLPSWRAE